MASCGGVDTNIIECEGGGDAGIWSILSLVINIFSIMVGIVAVISIAIFGIQYLTAGADVGKTAKAKKRIFQIVIGVAAYAIMWAFTQWLLPGGIFKQPDDIESVSISFDTSSAHVGDIISPTITIEPENATDKSFSLISADRNIAATTSTAVRCVNVGETTITVVTANNRSASATITCTKRPVTVVDPNKPVSTSGSTSGSVPSGALSESQVNNQISSMSVPTDAELQAAASALGINSTNLNKLLRLSHREGGYTDLSGSYYAKYLNVCTMINHHLENPTAEFYSNWGGGDGTYNESEMSNSRYNPSDDDRKFAYLALTHLDTRAWDAHGIMKENGYSYYGSWGSTVQRSSEAIYCTEYQSWDGNPNYGCIWPKSAGWYKE